MSRTVEVTGENGKTTGYLASPESGTGPAVLLLHAWWGLNDFFKRLADRLAAEGFVVLAPDLFHGSVANTIEEAEAQIAGEDYRTVIKDVVAATDHLLQTPGVAGDRLGVVGFSFGAAYANWLSTLRPAEVAAVVLFYGGSDEGSDFAKETRAAFLGHFSESDPYENAENAQAIAAQLREAGRNAAFYVYPQTGHWFFEDDRPDAFNKEAADLAWQRTIEFLHETLGS